MIVTTTSEHFFFLHYTSLSNILLISDCFRYQRSANAQSILSVIVGTSPYNM